jgi:hypothetical protein
LREREEKQKSERERKRERERLVVGGPKQRFFCAQGRNTNYIPAETRGFWGFSYYMQMCLPGRNTNYVPPSEKSSESCSNTMFEYLNRCSTTKGIECT